MSGRVHTIETLRSRIKGNPIDVVGVDFRRPVPRISCADGFSISVQANGHVYCQPRKNDAAWTHVELGFPSSPIPEFVEWRDGEAADEGNVFGYVPIEKVVELINSHGGEVVGQ